MKFIVCPFLLSLAFYCSAQTNNMVVKPIEILVKVQTTNQNIGSVYLKHVNDSVLFYSGKPAPYSSLVATNDLAIKYGEIISVSYRRKGAAGRAALVGAGIGLFTGILWGLIEGDDPPGFLSFSAFDKAVVLGGSLGVAGSVIGLITGSLVHKSFRIDLVKEKFLSFKNFVMNKTTVNKAGNF